MSREDHKRYDAALQRLRAEMASKPNEHHGREYLVAGVSIATEFVALKFGINWLAWVAAVFLWLSILSYTKNLSKSKPRHAFGVRGLTAVAVFFGTYGLIAMKTPHSETSPSIIVRPLTEEEMLCPHPLEYSMRQLPKPNDNNYSTELTIKNSKEPMLTVDIYMRTLYSNAYITYPPDQHEQLIMLGMYEADKSWLKLTATKGISEYRLEIHTFQPLRLKCVNQAN